MPPYTKWGRSRSGCYFCFYQQKIEWVRLKERHPDLFEKAKAYETTYAASGNTFTWSERESLAELERPERIAAIKDEHDRRRRRAVERGADLTLAEVFAPAEPGGGRGTPPASSARFEGSTRNPATSRRRPRASQGNIGQDAPQRGFPNIVRGAVVPFRVAARTILELGAELISSDGIAIYELVKNSLDAGSQTVEIRVQAVVRRSAYQAALDALVDRIQTSSILRDLRREALEDAPPPAHGRFFGGLQAALGNRTVFRRALKTLYSREHWMEIEDSGHGMSRQALIDDFLTIGTRSRRRGKVSRLGRPIAAGDLILGDKGVGRLSAMRLGEHLSVTTGFAGETHWNGLDIDWNRFSHASDAMVEDIDIQPVLRDEKADRAEAGTTVKVSALRGDWDQAVFATMMREQFSRIFDPFPPQTGSTRRGSDIFSVEFNGKQQDVDGVPQWLLDQAHATVRARYEVGTGGATFSGTIDYRLRNKSRTFRSVEAELLSFTDPIDDRTVRTTPRALRELGPFEVTFHWYNRRILAEVKVDTRTFKRAAVMKQVNEWAGGLMVFRNGFRINPYGSGEDDWLSLDRKALGARGYKVNRSQIIGKVALTSRNHRLIEQTNREGFADNQYKQILVGLLRHLFITEFRTFLTKVDDGRRILEMTTAEDLEARIKRTREEAERTVVELMRDVPSERRRLEGLRKLVLDLGELMRQARQLSAEIEDDKSKLTQLAGVGLMVEFILHEIGRTTKRALESLTGIDRAGLRAHDTAALAVLEDQLTSLRKRVDNLDPMSTSRRQIPEAVELGAAVRLVVAGRAAQFARHSISVIVEGDDAPWTVRAVRGMLTGILENLVENSVYWLAMEARLDRGFRPTITVRLDKRDGEISVSDNGPGVDASRAEEVFEPFVTAKPPGTGRGLGLYISRHMAEANKWTIRMVEEDDVRPGRLNTFVLDLSGAP